MARKNLYNGFNAQSFLKDSSDAQREPGLASGLSYNTTTKKFGAGSCYFNVANNELRYADADDWNFGSGDFTIEFWMYSSYTTANQDIIAQYSSTASDHSIAIRTVGTTGTVNIRVSNGTDSGAVNLTGTTNVCNGSQHHVAAVRYGDIFKLYVDGTSESTVTNAITIPNSSQPLKIGAGTISGSGGYYRGYLDEIRISKGIARYTGNFTPPASAFTGDSYTKLLLHFDDSTTVTDKVGTTNGTLYNSVVSQQGYINFIGNGYIGYSAKVIPLGAKTIEFTFKVTSWGSANHMVIANSDQSSTNNGDYIRIDYSNKFIQWISTKGTSGSNRINITTASNSLELDKWYYCVCTWDGTTNTNGVALYLCDLVKGTVAKHTGTAAATETNQSTYNLTVGKNPASAVNYLQGCIGHLGFWDEALPTGRVIDMFIEKLGGMAA